MTHPELYEIVKDHADAWNYHFHIVGRGDGSTEFVRRYGNTSDNPSHVEMELLGLGVVWLICNSPTKNVEIHIFGSDGDEACVVHAKARRWRRSGEFTRQLGPLAAVYAAIAEVKAKA